MLGVASQLRDAPEWASTLGGGRGANRVGQLPAGHGTKPPWFGPGWTWGISALVPARAWVRSAPWPGMGLETLKND